MAWVVDTSVLLDVRIGYPLDRATVSAECLEGHFAEGLTVCPVTFVELAPAFHGDLISQRKWLESLGISCREPWIEEDTGVAHTLWNGLIQRKRQGQAPKRPLPMY